MSKDLGTLVIVVLKAQNLNDIHSFYKQDVYAQLSLNGNKKSTPVDKKGGQHPLWDAEIRYPISKEGGEKNRVLEVSCWAKEPKVDEVLGVGKVDITETLRTGEFDDWVKLDINGTYRGDLYLEMTFYASAPPPVQAPTITSSAPLSNPYTNIPLNRRPSKLSPKDRMSRPSQPYHYGAPVSLSPQNSPSQSQIHSHFSNKTNSPQGNHLAPPGSSNNSSPPSSRSSSHSPTGHGRDAALPPLVEEGIPIGRGRGGGGKVPSILRPGNPKSSPTPVPSTGVSSTSLSTTSAYHPLSGTSSYQPVTGSAYTPVTGQGVSYQHPPQASPQPPEFNGPISFPVPQAAPLTSVGYTPPATTHDYGRSPYPPQQEGLPDPYLSKRYQTPLPLPSGSPYSPPPSSHAVGSTQRPKANSAEEKTAKALEEIARRKAQEEEDMEFARRLDREMNLE